MIPPVGGLLLLALVGLGAVHVIGSETAARIAPFVMAAILLGLVVALWIGASP